MGLALAQYLLERKWNVVQADINPPKESVDGARFVKCDVSSWDQQAALFQQAYEWTGRLDFCALNAGIDDRDDIFKSISRDPSKPPRKPNMKTVRKDIRESFQPFIHTCCPMHATSFIFCATFNNEECQDSSAYSF